MDTAAIVSTAIAVVSLAVSIFVLWRQHEAAGRAHFTADWEHRNSLVYTNHGPGAAREVHAKLDSRLTKDEIVTPYIGAFQSMRIYSTRTMGEPPIGPLHLSWRDNRRKVQRLDVFLPSPPSRQFEPPQQSRTDLEKAVRAVAHDEAKRQFNEAARQIRRGRR